MKEPTEEQLLDKEFWRDKSTLSTDGNIRDLRDRAIEELRNIHRDYEDSDPDEIGMRVAISHEAHLLIDLIAQYDALIKVPF